MVDRLKTAAECETREDVRYEIDRLDNLVVELLAERWGY
ncbi:MAG: chorismate mutase, partial [Pseudomonadota bacterium]